MPRLYVACGSGGLLKAGMTEHPYDRRRTLKHEFKKKGDTPAEVLFLDAITDTLLCEHYMHAELVQVATRCPGSREWYSTGDYAAVKEIAQRITDENRA